jgi:hypothetical protein
VHHQQDGLSNWGQAEALFGAARMYTLGYTREKKERQFDT